MTMICCRNLILQSETISSSLVGVISLKCFSKEVPVLQEASVPVLSRGVHADTLISQQAWAGGQKEEPSVNDAWPPLLPSELPTQVKSGRLTLCGTIPPGSTSSCLVYFGVVPGSWATIPKTSLFSVKAVCATEGWMRTLLFSVLVAAVLGTCWMIYIFGNFFKAWADLYLQQYCVKGKNC